MLALLALASTVAAPSTPHKPAIDPLASPAEMQRQIDALNTRPPPEEKQLAMAVLTAVAADAQRRDRCRPQTISLAPLQPVTLDAMVTDLITRGVIENGWLVSVKVDNCPPADPLRILVVRSADGHSLSGMFVGQGESLAWPSLVKDALRGLVGAAMKKLRESDANCLPKEMTPTAVRITAQADMGPVRYGVRFKGSWSEVWQFEPCNHRIGVPIAFRADGKGGGYWDIAADKIIYAP